MGGMQDFHLRGYVEGERAMMRKKILRSEEVALGTQDSTYIGSPSNIEVYLEGKKPEFH